jgi:3-hydroxyacyl-[acyl-carrier-protein] dehydratase
MRWMWIDRVVEIEPRKRLVAVKNVSMAEEHLHDHFPAEPGLPALPVMPASLILEGMAQTGGVLVGQAEEFRYKIVLGKVSKYEIRREATPGCVLRYTATVLRMDEQGSSIAGHIALLEPTRLRDGFVEIGTVEMMFSHLDGSMGGAGVSGVDFPEHNFVFGEAFRTMLSGSGITIS